MPTLTREATVYVLNLGDSENRFHPDWMAEVGGQLAEVAAAEGPRALVLTASGKFFSNGLDLEWVGANPDQFEAYAVQVHGLFAQLLALPVPTVAAIQGHAFAAGAMLSLSADFRVMRADRGFFCLPEVDIQIPFTRGMAALIQGRLSKRTAHAAMTTGRRYGGSEALEAGIIDAVADEDQVVPEALRLAGELADKAGSTLGKIKERMYADALRLLRETEDPLG